MALYKSETIDSKASGFAETLIGDPIGPIVSGPVTVQLTHTAAAGTEVIRLKQSLNRTDYNYVTDQDGVVIEKTMAASGTSTTMNIVHLHTESMLVIGYASGDASVTGIYVFH